MKLAEVITADILPITVITTK